IYANNQLCKTRPKNTCANVSTSSNRWGSRNSYCWKAGSRCRWRRSRPSNTCYISARVSNQCQFLRSMPSLWSKCSSLNKWHSFTASSQSSIRITIMAKFSLDDAIEGIDNVQATLNGMNPLTQSQQASFRSNGFLVSSTPTADGNGLPYSKITPGVAGKITRNIITWFVPQFGTVRMFINPQNITYTHKKL